MRSVAYAIALFAALLTSMPAHADLLSDAVQDYQFQDYPQAESKLRQLLSQDPNNLMAHYYLGAVLQQQGKLDEAISHFETVARAPQPIPGIESALANAYVAAGRATQALPHLEKNYRSHPSDDHAAIQYATALQAAGRSEDATAIYRQLIDAGSPYADQARYQLSQIQVDQGSYMSAVETLKQIPTSSPYAGAAKSYTDALEPVTRPLSIYAAVQTFYNDNPASTSSSLIGTTGPLVRGSDGINVIGSINTRPLELTPHLSVKLGYLLYGTYYRPAAARQLDFTGHFINPSVTYRFSSSNEIELKGDLQFFDFGNQKLSTNTGATLTATHRWPQGHSANLHVSYMDKRYTDNFVVSGLVSNLKYLDAQAIGIGAGVKLAGSSLIKGWNGSLSVDYTFNDENTGNYKHPDPVVSAKAQDSRFREQAVQLNALLPLGLGATRMTLIGNASYSFKDYINVQSGNIYWSAAGAHVKSDIVTTGGRLQIQVWPKIGLNFSVGADTTIGRSNATELQFKSSRYFAELSASY